MRVFRYLSIVVIATLVIMTAFTGTPGGNTLMLTSGLSPTGATQIVMTSGEFHTLVVLLSDRLGIEPRVLKTAFLLAQKEITFERGLEARIELEDAVHIDRDAIVTGLRHFFLEKEVELGALTTVQLDARIDRLIDRLLFRAGLNDFIARDFVVVIVVEPEVRFDVERNVRLVVVHQVPFVQVFRTLVVNVNVFPLRRIERNVEIEFEREGIQRFPFPERKVVPRAEFEREAIPRPGVQREEVQKLPLPERKIERPANIEREAVPLPNVERPRVERAPEIDIQRPAIERPALERPAAIERPAFERPAVIDRAPAPRLEREQVVPRANVERAPALKLERPAMERPAAFERPAAAERAAQAPRVAPRVEQRAPARPARPD